ncbi:hypothetical protein GGR32_000948 [Mesonia hippocampi]|uniref:Uncharacterized protein n=1 Tax=Mesonia hippocampi TaxID=1628250 RepID=A0A840EKJ3_9FLAO|nr:hypothetical protein [Mesonia hippocampi]MBB4118668.1 hypothetical protein [Mesonia hippocampi]
MNKIDNNIKEYFLERSIQPAQDSWGNLEKALAKKKTKQRRKYYFTGITAAVVVLLVFVLGIQTNPISEKEHIPIKSTSPIIVETQKKTHDEKVNKELVEIDKERRKPQQNIVAKSKKAENKQALKKVAPILLDKNIHTKNIAIENTFKEVINKEELEKTVNSYLKKAQIEVRAQKILFGSSNYVDAQLLQKDVEETVNPSIPTKINHWLEQRIIQLKSTVVNSISKKSTNKNLINKN